MSSGDTSSGDTSSGDLSSPATHPPTAPPAGQLSPTGRSTVRRARERARLDPADLHAILDEALLCHVAQTGPDGAPRIIPTLHARDGDRLLLHGSTGAWWTRAATGPLCVAVTLLDGLVHARSAFHFSVNYRSAVIFGTGRVLPAEAAGTALRLFTERLWPGVWSQVRPPSDKELAATSVIAVDLTEASVKIRSGPPGDEEADVAAGTAWAGVLPLHTVAGPVRPCPLLPPGVTPPPHVLARAAAFGTD
jgi:hypothetical protein